MRTIRVYRNLSAKDKLFGLELADWLIILLVFFAVFTANKESLCVNGLLLLLSYLGLRGLKRGKPDGYVLCLARYAAMGRLKDKPRFGAADPAGRYPR